MANTKTFIPGELIVVNVVGTLLINNTMSLYFDIGNFRLRAFQLHT